MRSKHRMERVGPAHARRWVRPSAQCLAVVCFLQAVLHPAAAAEGALRFDGTNQFVELPVDGVFDITGPLTLEAWVKVEVFDRKWQAVVTKGNAWGLLRYLDTDRLAFRTHDGASVHDLVSEQPFPTNAWHHVAAVYDGAQKRLYVDGVLQGSASYAAPLAQSSRSVLFGANAENPGGDCFRGDLENVRLWSVGRSLADLQATATNHLRGSEPGLVGDWRFDETAGLVALNSALHGRPGLLAKSTHPPARIAGLGFGPPLPGPQALRFDGQDDCIRLPATGRFDFPQQLTAETWIRLDDATNGTAAVLSKGTNAWELAVDANALLVFTTDGVTGPDPQDPTQRVSTPDLRSRTRLDTGTWYHVAAVWNGLAGRKDLYLNGQLDASVTNLTGSLPANTERVLFGARPAAAPGQFFTGILDEVRLWELALDHAQIAARFGRRLHGTELGLAGSWSFDEGDGPVVRDGGLNTAPADGALEGGMGNFNRVDGRLLDEPWPLQYCLALDGAPGFIRIGAANPFNLTNLTIEAWVKPSGNGFRNILMKGDHGYALAIDGENHLRYFIDSTTQNSLRSTLALEPQRDPEGTVITDADGRPLMAWNHVAVVVDQQASTTTFYINGRPAGSFPVAVVRNNSGDLILGRQGSLAAANYFDGLMDEVRLWNVPRAPAEIEFFAFTPLPTTDLPGLVAYWDFDQTTGSTLPDRAAGGHDGTLVNFGTHPWRDGTDWGVPAMTSGLSGLTPVPASSGLWIGQVVLNQVSEVQKAVQGASDLATPTADVAAIRLLLHVGNSGQVQLLKDVILMRKPGAPVPSSGTGTNAIPPVASDGSPTNLVLVTRPERIGEFEGIARRGGKLVGIRYGTVAYDFDGTELPLLGGVGPGAACLGRIHLSADHPTNPYRHKYHPDHRHGFDLVRQVSVQFDQAAGDPGPPAPGFGVEYLTGTYRETVTGLHKIPLHVQGTVRLDRVATVGVLNE